MKRLFFILTLLSAIFIAKAQEYDELDLIGKWNVTSITPGTNAIIGVEIRSFEKINFFEVASYAEYGGMVWGDIINWRDGDRISDYPIHIRSWWISNSNKLHMISDNVYVYGILSFIIEQLTSDTMILLTYDGKNRIELKKDTPSAVNNVNANNITHQAEAYSLDGIRIEKPENGIVIYHDGEKSTKEIIRR